MIINSIEMASKFKKNIGVLLSKKKRDYPKLEKNNKPINFLLPNDLNVNLYPKGQIAELLYTSDFECDLLEILGKYLKNDMVFIDVGANIGLYSIFANSIIDKGKIYAFEPAKDIYEIFKQNIKLQPSSCIQPFNLAISNQEGELNLLCDEGMPDGYRFTSFTDEKYSKNIDKINSTKATTLDIFLTKKSNPMIDFIKIDVEGFEYNVLEGAKETLKHNKNIVVLFESSEPGLVRAGNSQVQLNKFMIDLGFKLVAWDVKTHRWVSEITDVNRIGNVWATRNISILPN